MAAAAFHFGDHGEDIGEAEQDPGVSKRIGLLPALIG
jgi:hypothetical protein